MALATEVTGGGKLVSRQVSTRRYWVAPPIGSAVEYQEVSESETREWVALTQAAAEGVADTNAQPATGTYTYDVQEDKRVIGSYKLVRSFETSTVSQVE